MAHSGLSKFYVLSFIAQLICGVLAFQVRLQPKANSLKPPLTNQHKLNKLNTPTALRSEKNDLNDERARSTRRRILRTTRTGRRRRRRYTFIHQESYVTAAGAESLFSLSWWPFSYEMATKSSTIHNEQYLNSLDLPSIDCSWACVSNTEQIQLQQMKLLLRSELKMITDVNLHEKHPDVYSDLRLLRFLRKSKDRDVTSAAERYRSFLQWREQNEVDSIRDMVEDCNGSFTPTAVRLQTVASHFPMNFDYLVQETDELNEGDKSLVKPAILNVGEFDTRGITEKILASNSDDVELEDFLNYWIFLYESIHLRLYQQSLQFGQMTFLDEVCDLSGLSLQQFSPSFGTKVMSPWLKMTQAYYPETTRRIYILHPPAIIKVAWKLVTPLLSQGTIDKIRFVRKFDGSANEFVEIASWLD
eukprot:scaffold2641_cov110-Skeletonema_dohrnii-CCMP3373.AAC.10